jgi:hypothetical protein
LAREGQNFQECVDNIADFVYKTNVEVGEEVPRLTPSGEFTMASKRFVNPVPASATERMKAQLSMAEDWTPEHRRRMDYLCAVGCKRSESLSRLQVTVEYNEIVTTGFIDAIKNADPEVRDSLIIVGETAAKGTICGYDMSAFLLCDGRTYTFYVDSAMLIMRVDFRFLGGNSVAVDIIVIDCLGLLSKITDNVAVAVLNGMCQGGVKSYERTDHRWSIRLDRYKDVEVASPPWYTAITVGWRALMGSKSSAWRDAFSHMGSNQHLSNLGVQDDKIILYTSDEQTRTKFSTWLEDTTLRNKKGKVVIYDSVAKTYWSVSRQALVENAIKWLTGKIGYSGLRWNLKNGTCNPGHYDFEIDEFCLKFNTPLVAEIKVNGTGLWDYLFGTAPTENGLPPPPAMPSTGTQATESDADTTTTQTVTRVKKDRPFSAVTWYSRVPAKHMVHDNQHVVHTSTGVKKLNDKHVLDLDTDDVMPTLDLNYWPLFLRKYNCFHGDTVLMPGNDLSLLVGAGSVAPPDRVIQVSYAIGHHYVVSSLKSKAIRVVQDCDALVISGTHKKRRYPTGLPECKFVLALVDARDSAENGFIAEVLEKFNNVETMRLSDTHMMMYFSRVPTRGPLPGLKDREFMAMHPVEGQIPCGEKIGMKVAAHYMSGFGRQWPIVDLFSLNCQMSHYIPVDSELKVGYDIDKSCFHPTIEIKNEDCYSKRDFYGKYVAINPPFDRGADWQATYDLLANVAQTSIGGSLLMNASSHPNVEAILNLFDGNGTIEKTTIPVARQLRHHKYDTSDLTVYFITWWNFGEIRWDMHLKELKRPVSSIPDHDYELMTAAMPQYRVREEKKWEAKNPWKVGYSFEDMNEDIDLASNYQYFLERHGLQGSVADAQLRLENCCVRGKIRATAGRNSNTIKTDSMIWDLLKGSQVQANVYNLPVVQTGQTKNDLDKAISKRLDVPHNELSENTLSAFDHCLDNIMMPGIARQRRMTWEEVTTAMNKKGACCALSRYHNIEQWLESGKARRETEDCLKRWDAGLPSGYYITVHPKNESKGRKDMDSNGLVDVYSLSASTQLAELKRDWFVVPRVIQFGPAWGRAADYTLFGNVVRQQNTISKYYESMTGAGLTMVGDIVRAKYDSYPDPALLTLDLAKWDHSVSYGMIMSLKRMMKRLVEEKDGATVDARFRETAAPTCLSRNGDLFQRIGQVSSGDLLTSFGNTAMVTACNTIGICKSLGIPVEEYCVPLTFTHKSIATEELTTLREESRFKIRKNIDVCGEVFLKDDCKYVEDDKTIVNVPTETEIFPGEIVLDEGGGRQIRAICKNVRYDDFSQVESLKKIKARGTFKQLAVKKLMAKCAELKDRIQEIRSSHESVLSERQKAIVANLVRENYVKGMRVVVPFGLKLGGIPHSVIHAKSLEDLQKSVDEWMRVNDDVVNHFGDRLLIVTVQRRPRVNMIRLIKDKAYYKPTVKRDHSGDRMCMPKTSEVRYDLVSALHVINGMFNTKDINVGKIVLELASCIDVAYWTTLRFQPTWHWVLGSDFREFRDRYRSQVRYMPYCHLHVDTKYTANYPCSILQDGDDGTIVGPMNLIQHVKRGLPDVLTTLGKAVADSKGSVSLHSRVEDIEFLSHKYCRSRIAGRVTYLPTKNLATILGKLMLTIKAECLAASPKGRSITSSKLLSYLLLYPHMRQVRDLCLIGLSMCGPLTVDAMMSLKHKLKLHKLIVSSLSDKQTVAAVVKWCQLNGVAFSKNADTLLLNIRKRQNYLNRRVREEAVQAYYSDRGSHCSSSSYLLGAAGKIRREYCLPTLALMTSYKELMSTSHMNDETLREGVTAFTDKPLSAAITSSFHSLYGCGINQIALMDPTFDQSNWSTWHKNMHYIGIKVKPIYDHVSVMRDLLSRAEKIGIVDTTPLKLLPVSIAGEHGTMTAIQAWLNSLFG